MDYAYKLIGGGDDHEGGDFFLLHEVESLGGEGVGRDGAGVASHALAGGEVESIFAAMFEKAAEVSVTDDADEKFVFGDGSDA